MWKTRKVGQRDKKPPFDLSAGFHHWVPKIRERIRQEKGYSIPELLVGMTVSLLVFYGVTGFSIQGAHQTRAADTKMTLQSTVTTGLTQMLEELRESAPLKIQCNNATIDFEIPSGFDDDGDIIWSNTIRYQIGGTGSDQLIRVQSGVGNRIIANDVDTIRFIPNKTPEPTLVTIELDVKRQTVKGHFYTETMTGEAKIRNG